MNRLYVVETAVSCTGAKADHRLALRAGEIEGLARALAAKLGVAAGGRRRPVRCEKWVAAVAKDLEAHRGRCLVLAGDRQPPVVHLLAHALNEHLGNVGQTVTYTAPIDARPGDRTQSLRELVQDMEQGRVEFLVILGGNPVYTAPADLELRRAFAEGSPAHSPRPVRRRDLVSVPLAPARGPLPGSLERRRAYDGTASIVQPLIEPLYQGRSAHEVRGAAGQSARDARPGDRPQRIGESVGKLGTQKATFEQFWQQALHDGVIPDTAFQPKTVKLKEDWQKHPATAAITRTRVRPEGRGNGSGNRLPAGPDDLRRLVGQQRLAAGIAQADHEAHLGQRRHHEPGHGPSNSASSWAAMPTAASTAAITCRWSNCSSTGGSVRAPPGSCPATPTAR